MERSHRQKLAVCFATVEHEQESFTALSFRGSTGVGSTTETLSVQRNWERIYVGPTYAIAFGDLTLGLSLHGAVTNASTQTEGDSINLPAGANAIPSTLGMSGSGHSIDLTSIVGAKYRLGPFTLGASVQAPVLHLYGTYDATWHEEYTDAAIHQAQLANASGNFHAPPPVRFGLGLGVIYHRWIVEADAAFLLADSGAVSTDLSASTVTVNNAMVTQLTASSSYVAHTHSVVDVAAGAEYFVTPRFSVLGGAGTSFTSMPPLDTTTSVGSLVQSRTNRLALATGIGSHGGADLLVGLQLSYAWGQSLVVNPFSLPATWAATDVSTYAATLILAGATDFVAVAKAVEKVKGVMMH